MMSKSIFPLSTSLLNFSFLFDFEEISVQIDVDIRHMPINSFQYAYSSRNKSNKIQITEKNHYFSENVLMNTEPRLAIIPWHNSSSI